jgi:hypothetical protein
MTLSGLFRVMTLGIYRRGADERVSRGRFGTPLPPVPPTPEKREQKKGKKMEKKKEGVRAFLFCIVLFY